MNIKNNISMNKVDITSMLIDGIIFPKIPYSSFKSTGNGKVYYIKPIINISIFIA